MDVELIRFLASGFLILYCIVVFILIQNEQKKLHRNIATRKYSHPMASLVIGSVFLLTVTYLLVSPIIAGNLSR